MQTAWNTNGPKNVGWSPDGALLAASDGFVVQLWEPGAGRLCGNILLQPALHGLTIAPDGRYRGDDKVDSVIVMVVQKEDGTQELLQPAEFEKKYGFKNEPDKVHLLQPPPRR